MNKKLLTIAAVSAIVMAGTAASLYDAHFTARQKESRMQKPAAQTAVASLAESLASEKNAPMRIVTVEEEDFDEIDKYGDLILKVEEDFSLLTTGSEDEPDMMTLLEVNSMELFDNAWWTFNAKYTHTPNWGVNDSYPAGGCLFMDGERGQVHLNTPMIKLNDFSGLGVLEFRVRTRIPGAVFNGLLVEAAETNNMTAKWDFLGTAQVQGITNEWTTYRLLFPNCGPTTMFNIVTQGSTLLFIDDVKVYEIMPYVTTPEIKAHTDYQGTSFKANWMPVEGADHYLFSLYTYGSADDRFYLIEDKEVTGTSYTVSNVESGEVYFYNVKAVKGSKVSYESNEHCVYDLERPVLNDAEIIGGYGYKASWNEVPQADVYNYWAFQKQVADKDGEFVVTDEEFINVRDLDGQLTGWIKNDPDDEGLSYPEFYPMEMKQPGWRGTHCAPYTDYIAIDGWWYEWVGEDAGFVSPELDLSKDGGKFTLSADLSGNTCLWPLINEDGTDWKRDPWGEVIFEERVTQACVALFAWDDELGDYKQVELVYIPKSQGMVTTDWKNFSFNLTKGTARSKVGIYAIRGLDMVFIDNLRITQNYKKGESLMSPFKYDRFHGMKEADKATEIEVTIPAFASGNEVYHMVSAFGRQLAGDDGYNKYYNVRESKFSDMKFVRSTVYDPSGVNGVHLDESLAGESRYYNLNGVRIANPDAAGIYVKVTGNKAEKIIKR